ncbi:hypothetical protein [Streptomyces niger]|uniref:hypothetical protein n=1 Tax=Streptomyces niger TaxID=66373 RepID=UPI0018FE2AF2|nr:hypothetical protein [Streptomyces niger]
MSRRPAPPPAATPPVPVLSAQPAPAPGHPQRQQYQGRKGHSVHSPAGDRP